MVNTILRAGDTKALAFFPAQVKSGREYHPTLAPKPAVVHRQQYGIILLPACVASAGLTAYHRACSNVTPDMQHKRKY